MAQEATNKWWDNLSDVRQLAPVLPRHSIQIGRCDKHRSAPSLNISLIPIYDLALFTLVCVPKWSSSSGCICTFKFGQLVNQCVAKHNGHTVALFFSHSTWLNLHSFLQCQPCLFTRHARNLSNTYSFRLARSIMSKNQFVVPSMHYYWISHICVWFAG